MELIPKSILRSMIYPYKAKIMTQRMDDLERICDEVVSKKEEVSMDTKKEFWRIVREIKRDSNPDQQEIIKAAEIRDHLFVIRRGKTYSLRLGLGIMLVLGVLTSVIPYVYLLSFPLDWFSIMSWTMDNWILFVLRFLAVFMGIAFFYPFGRLIAGRLLRIRIMGMCWDDFREPTLKIDYVSFLGLSPSKRKWFFFLGGFWTVITSLVIFISGAIIAMDFTAAIPLIVLLMFEGGVIISKKPTYKLGEMGLFNRERKIEREWKERNKTSQKS